MYAVMTTGVVCAYARRFLPRVTQAAPARSVAAARDRAASWRSKRPMKLRRMLRRKLLFWAAVAALTLLAAVYQEYI